MPKPPHDIGQFDKVNYVIDAWARPCDAPWYIYVETLKPALLKAFITLITFGWDDVARGYLRPRGLGGRRTGKRKGKWGRHVPRFPEIGELIGSNLPGAEEIKGKKWHWLGNTLWRIDTVAQRALFWWLVADVTVDLAYDWTSLLYETVWCQASDLGRFSVHDDDPNGRPPGIWWTLQYLKTDYEVSPPSWFATHGATGSRTCIVVAAVDFTTGHSPPSDVTIEVRIVHNVTLAVYAQTEAGPPDPAGEWAIPLKGNVPPNTQFRVQVRGSGGNFTIRDRICTAQEIDDA